jgi:hypothetical protein
VRKQTTSDTKSNTEFKFLSEDGVHNNKIDSRIQFELR